MAESYKHLDIKTDLYFSLLGDDQYADIEKTVGRTRTDVLAEINGHTVAIEIQYTPIPIKSIVRRMQEHTAEGHHTLWLIPEETLVQAGRVRNLNWVAFIQRLQEGCLFLPDTDSRKVIPARVDNSLIFSKGEIIAGKRKILDKIEAIDLGDLDFKVGEFGLNVVTYSSWLDSYGEILE